MISMVADEIRGGEPRADMFLGAMLRGHDQDLESQSSPALRLLSLDNGFTCRDKDAGSHVRIVRVERIVRVGS